MQERETRLAVMDAALKRALIDAGKGRVKPANEVFDRLEKKFAGWPASRGNVLIAAAAEADLESTGVPITPPGSA